MTRSSASDDADSLGPSAQATGDTYVHGTDASEQARLAALNRLTNPAFLEFLALRPGQRVLEVGSGLGLLAAEVSAITGRFTLGVEFSAAQIAASSRDGVLPVRGDAHRLPLASDRMDIAYCRFVLEHLAEPVQALKEIRRVLRTGGTVAVMENDTSLLRLDPPCPAFDRAWSVLVRCQARLGGDSFIGRRLFRLLHDAGFTGIELSVQPELHWQSSPAFTAWLVNLAGNLASARDVIARDEPAGAALVAEGIDEVLALADHPAASATFVWNRARAVK